MHVHYVCQSSGFFTTIDKDIWFQGLVPLSNRIKEDCYRSLGVVMKHYNKAGYSVKLIECDGKFKSIMDEVSNEIEIEVNYVKPDDHVPEADRNDRVIK